MEVNPKDVDHVRMAADAGLGPMNIRFINLFGERLEDVKTIFHYHFRFHLDEN